MKTKGQLIQKIKQVRYRYLKKFLDKCLAQNSQNCLYNRPSSFDVRDVFSVCVCGYGIEKKEWQARPCDKRLNPELAQNCSKFELLNTKDELKEEFNVSLDALPLPAIASKFPDLAALLWVLSEDTEEVDDG